MILDSDADRKLFRREALASKVFELEVSIGPFTVIGMIVL
jgi:hypothetical protein